ncbi:serine/threonine-protein kinase [Streptomyces sp. H27-D2]|uniref:serine/threonine-protein kinase n=1 Tax=Streptomyces sp. H27-D2 TaxID=3046304 RepID=UPI002DBFC6C7|nr:serine/threonine-protein kinase [Streptomyces sp. H27-D2]MEC4017461.1 serine/threonine-protein kinase [Streptomyces sp. H27-D2]
MGSSGDTRRLIAGRYRLGVRLGRGGMGTVWRATDELLGREVAVKELHPGDGLSEPEAQAQRERTMREARTVAQIKHPNVIVLHDVVEQDGRPWIVMELVEGGSLGDRLAAGGPVSPREAARIGLALLGALRVAHARGVLHRDIKPANVLMEAGARGSRRVVLTDFGIAKVAGVATITENGAFVGSPEYTAPERMAGGRTGPESDLWSLGALLCSAVSGESLFHRDTLGGVLHAVVSDDILPPAAAGPLLPVVRGLLQRDPELRIAGDEAERLLRAYLASGRMPEAGAAYTPTRRGVSEVPLPPMRVTPAGQIGPMGPVALSAGGPSGRRPQPLAVPGRPARGGRTRTALLALLVVIALGGAGAGVAALVLNQEGENGNGGSSIGGPDSEPPDSASGRERASPGQSPPSGSGGAPKPTRKPSVSAPPGYRSVADPAGFALAVPNGFTRSFEPPRVFYYSPGEEFRIGVLIQDPRPGGPMAAMRDSAAAAPERYKGYRDGEVTETRHDGHRAARWEFTWNGFAGEGVPRHTFDISWEEGGKMYDLWVSAPDTLRDEGRRHFDTALESFVRTRPDSDG